MSLTNRQKNLQTLFVTAVEGGINYWCSVDNYVWDESKWTYAQMGADLIPSDSEDDQHFRLTPAIMGTGLQKIVAADRKLGVTRPLSGWGTYNTLLWSLSQPEDVWADRVDFDAIDADVIAQVGLGLTYTSLPGGHLTGMFG